MFSCAKKHMNCRIATLLVACVLCWLTPSSTLSQVPPAESTENDKWIRVQSDDLEFSIEVPAQYKFFANKDGFFVSEGGTSNSYELKNMYMVNAYIHGTLVSFETYDAKKGAVEAIYKGDVYGKEDLAKSTLQKSGYAIRQTVANSGNTYIVRQYFSSKKHIYVLTAASRNGETQEIRRFLDSLGFAADTGRTQNPTSVSFSKLPNSDVAVEMHLEKDAPQNRKNTLPLGSAKDDDKTMKKLVILIKQRPAYVDSARSQNISGTIRVKVTFSTDGYIPKITVLQTLPEGLLRQALFAALRMKFIPQEKNGKLESAERTIEYGFYIL